MDPIKAEDLVERDLGRDTDRVAEATFEVINLLAEVFSHLRSDETAPDMESVIITALVSYAGCLHGEMLALGLVGELTDDAVTKLLLHNFRMGTKAGQAKVARIAEDVKAEGMAQSGQGQPT